MKCPDYVPIIGRVQNRHRRGPFSSQLFGKTERGPDEALRLQFEAIPRFSEEEKKVVRSVLEGLLLTHEARRWSSG
jgi:hypothetical protein